MSRSTLSLLLTYANDKTIFFVGKFLPMNSEITICFNIYTKIWSVLRPIERAVDLWFDKHFEPKKPKSSFYPQNPRSRYILQLQLGLDSIRIQLMILDKMRSVAENWS